MLLVSLISYIDRNTLAILAPTILRDTHLNGEQYGFIISCFSVAYMIGNPVWGRILDRWGVRRGMTAAVGIWSVAAAAHAWAGSFLTFGIARAVLGAGEGATFPGGLRTVTQTLPPRKRGRGLAIAYSGGSLGAMITPLIVTPIALRFGWHGAFFATGSFGLAWLIFWAFAGKGVDRRTEFTSASLDWKHPALWAFMAAYALGAMPLGFILYDSSLYLHARFGWNQATLGKVLWLPPLGWEVGYFVWGAVVRPLRPALPEPVTNLDAAEPASRVDAFSAQRTRCSVRHVSGDLCARGLCGAVDRLCDPRILIRPRGVARRSRGRVVERRGCSDQSRLRTTVRPQQLSDGVPHRGRVPRYWLSFMAMAVNARQPLSSRASAAS